MPVENTEQVKQYFILQDKSELELRAICEGMKLKTHGVKQDLINRLLSLEIPHQESVLVPTVIPFRTRDNNMQPMEAAANMLRKWRKVIFNAHGNMTEFQLVNSKGKAYSMELKYLECGTRTLKYILDHKWLAPLQNHRELVQMLERKPEDYVTRIVRKPDSKGNTWMMLHCEAKVQAA